MDLLQWFKQTQNKRNLITTNVSFINALIRQTHSVTTGVKVTSLQSIAQEITAYHYAKQNQHYQILSASFAFLFFQDVLLANLNRLPYYQSHASLLDTATMQEIFRMMNIIRLADADFDTTINNATTKEDAMRLQDLKTLISIYTTALQEQDYLDTTQLYRIALQEVSSWQDNEMYLDPVTTILDEQMYLSQTELQLLAQLQKYTQPEVTSVTYPDSLYAFLNQKKHGEVHFFKAFGEVNEVKYVIQDVLEKKIPFGQVGMMYVSQSQVNNILSELDGAGIPYSFADGYQGTMNVFVQWVLNVIAWVENQYEEKYLYPVLEVPFLIAQVDEEVTLHTLSMIEAIVRGKFRIVNDGHTELVEYHAGWSRQRYLAAADLFLQASLNPDLDPLQAQKYAFYGEILKDLCHLFDEDKSIAAIYRNLLDFFETYVKPNHLAYLQIKPALQQFVEAYTFRDRHLSLSETLEQITEDLNTIRITQPENTAGIVIQSAHGLQFLERPYTYCIGMSAVNMKGSSTSSPVCSDDELQQFVSSGYVPIAANENVRQQKAFKMTLASLQQGTLTLGYPFYDTQEETECNPSVAYLDLLSIYHNEENAIANLPYFEYGIPSKAIHLQSYRQLEDSHTNPHLFDVCLHYSASTLEELSECPRKFYYDVVKDLSPLEFLEPKPNTWLDARSKGNFIHSILEHYTRRVFSKSSNVPFDEEIFQAIVDEQFIHYQNIVPTIEQWLMKKEVREYSTTIRQYLLELHEQYQKSGYVFLLSEESFRDVIVQSTIALPVVGKIDRIDGYVDHANKKVLLRTIDYKTGKKSRVDAHIETGIAQQRKVYTTALQQKTVLSHLQSRLHKLYPDVDFSDYQFVEAGFFYIFIGDVSENEETGKVLTGQSAILDDSDNRASEYRLSQMIQHCINAGEFLDRFTIGEEMEKNYTYDEADPREGVIANLRGPMGKRKKSRNALKTKCTYCPFTEICKSAKL